eukprot:s636_g27.t1
MQRHMIRASTLIQISMATCSWEMNLQLVADSPDGPDGMGSLSEHRWDLALDAMHRLVVEGIQPRATQLVHAFTEAAHWRAALRLGDPMAARDGFFQE